MDDPADVSQSGRVTVLVVDDQPWVRVGLATLLERDPRLQVVGNVESGEAALAFFEAASADVVLMDVRMPGMGGVRAASELQARRGARVILLTTFEEEDDMIAGLTSGVAGYLLKDVPIETLRDTVVRVARGERYVQPSVAEKLARALARRAEPTPLHEPDALTPRERDVLALIARGLANKRIASALNLSESTVKVHVSNVLAKLGARDRLEAVQLALSAGLLSRGED